MIDIFINNYLTRIFDWLIETSIMASILVGLILCVKVLLRNKLTPRWHYLLWMILIVRLLLPWSPDSSYSIYSILSYGYESTLAIKSQPNNSLENSSIYETETKEMPTKNVVLEEERYVTNTLPAVKENNKEKTNNSEKRDKPISAYTFALYIWLMGVIVLSISTYLVNRRLSNYIKTQTAITDKRILDIFNDCKKSMSVQKSIPLLLAGKISSPTVLGFFRPRVLLSRALVNRLTEQQLQHIFYHELAHIKRKDVGLNWLMHCLLILNWFNPILWLANVLMREDQELACDAYALTFMEEEEKISYGFTIINLLEHYSNYYQVPSLANLSRNKSTIKRRISMIEKFQKKSYRWSAIGVIAVIVVSSLSLLNAHADGSNGKKQEQTTEKEKKIENKNGETVYIPPRQKENFNDMTKEEILTKMINTVDNFETAKGEFKKHYDNINSPDGSSLIEYELSLKNKAGGYSKQTYKENGKDKVIYHYYKDGTIWDIDEETGEFIEAKYSDPEPYHSGTLKINEAFQVDNEGISVTKLRERPPIGEAMSSLFPYEIASNFTRDMDNWEIEKQNEMLLGHNTLVIKGKVNRHDSQSFRFWVDKDTGILVKYETYNSTGDVVDYLYPRKLEINVPIDSKKFKPNLEGYKKEDLSKMPSMTTGNIDELIPEELKEQWEEAKKKPNETTVLNHNGKWYIFAKKGYLVDRIDAIDKEGTLYLAKVSPQKSQFIFHALAEGYEIDSLEIIYQ